MFPTLVSGERLLVNRFVYARVESGPLEFIGGTDGYVFHGPQRGDIVIFHPPSDDLTDYVKRVIAIPGDRVDLRQGKVYVNGERVDEPYISGKFTSSQNQQVRFPLDVPEGNYFVLGDNRPVSNDSRSWGFVPADDIVGRAWFGYWPFSSIRIFG